MDRRRGPAAVTRDGLSRHGAAYDMMMLESMLRLGAVFVLLIWLPGWMVSGRPLRPFYVLDSSMLGIGIHLAVLFLATLVTGQLDMAGRLVIAGTVIVIVVAAIARVRGKTLAGIDTAPPPSLSIGMGFAVSAALGVAAILRWFHNYHFDDLQHFVYLTELTRLNQAFPDTLTARLGYLPWSGGEAGLLISRYPFWAASYAVLGSIAGISMGDTYYLLGLGGLALALGLMTALLEQAVGSRIVACLGLAALLLGGVLLTDDFLNFGGYPFQSGKLLVLVAAASAIAYWRVPRPRLLCYLAIGMCAGPLFHTNNVVSVVVIAIFTAGLAALRKPQGRALLMTSAAAVALLGVLALSALATGGFLRGVVTPPVASRVTLEAVIASAGDLTSQPAGSAQPGQEASAKVVIPPQNVSDRMSLFFMRGAPSELLFALAVVGVCTIAMRRLGRLPAVLMLALVCLLFAAHEAAAIGRQAVSTAFKPGYLPLRSSLMALSPIVRGQRIVVDPMTGVLGVAAGWSLPSKPGLEAIPQMLPQLSFHPEVRGEVLTRLLSANRPSTVIVNEGIVGAGVSAKFEGLLGVSKVASIGAAAPLERATRDHMHRVTTTLFSLDAGAFQQEVAASARLLAQLLFRRPVQAFRIEGAPAAEGLAAAEELLNQRAASMKGQPAPASGHVQHPFLNTVLIEAWPPAGCAEVLGLEITGTSTFGDAVNLVLSGNGHITRSAMTLAFVPVEAVIALPKGTCGPDPVVVFVHGGYTYDFRFQISRLTWR